MYYAACIADTALQFTALLCNQTQNSLGFLLANAQWGFRL